MKDYRRDEQLRNRKTNVHRLILRNRNFSFLPPLGRHFDRQMLLALANDMEPMGFSPCERTTSTSLAESGIGLPSTSKRMSLTLISVLDAGLSLTTSLTISP